MKMSARKTGPPSKRPAVLRDEPPHSTEAEADYPHTQEHPCPPVPASDQIRIGPVDPDKHTHKDEEDAPAHAPERVSVLSPLLFVLFVPFLFVLFVPLLLLGGHVILLTSPLITLPMPVPIMSKQDPVEAQAEVLERLVEGYRQTDYGREVGETIKEFRSALQPATYRDLLPYLKQVREGRWQVLLSEPPVEWALSRGTTGKRKLIPLTVEDVRIRLQCTPRAVFSWVERTGKTECLEGWTLNLGYPSKVSVSGHGDADPVGHSSGIYSRWGTNWGRMVPTQEEIDSAGEEPERRFALIWERSRDKQITLCCGVTQQMIDFGGWLRRHKRLLPRRVWDVGLLACTSTAHIHDRYSYPLRALYGEADIVEMYGATEGMYGQQIDSKPYIVPNWDSYLFEVLTKRRGAIMLYEMRRGEWGRFVVSSATLPRYLNGDGITCMGTERGYGKYFRVWREHSRR